MNFSKLLGLRYNSLTSEFLFRLAGLVLVIAGGALAFGQGIITGSIVGNVNDQSGAIVVGARVTATNTQTNQKFTTETNSAGLFSVRSVPTGTYTISVEAPSFQRLELHNIPVTVAKETTLSNLTLPVGSSREVVTVESAAPIIEAQPTQISMSFDSKKVQDLPYGRGIDQLALYLPGVSTGGSVGRGNNNGALFSVNGQRTRSNNFQIDGQGMNDQSVTGPAIFLENPDIVAEYQVMTNYDASYGRNMGSQVNIVTKNGTNAFHGTASETWRGSTFDSFLKQEKNPLLGFCTPHQNPTTCNQPVISKYVRNIFGGTVGGPVIKDKAWFFGSALWDRIRAGGSTLSDSQGRVAPTTNGLATLKAAFPNSPAVGFLQRFGPGVTPGNPRFGSQVMRNVSNGTTTVPVEFGTVARNIPSVSNTRQFTGRGDVQLTSKDRVFARYLIDDEISTNVDNGDGPQGFVEDVPSRGQQLGLDWTRQFSNSFVNQVRFNWTRLHVLFQGGTTGCTVDGPTKCPIRVGFTDATILPMGLANNFPQGRANDSYEWQDNLTWVKGVHTLKFGGYYSRQHPDSFFLPTFNGEYNFPTFNAFIRNVPDRFLMADGSFTIKYIENDLAFYGQDDFRVRPNLTLTFGLRWEYFQDTINKLHDLSLTQQTGPHPFWSTSLPLDRTTIAKVPEALHNFEPVVGFSWGFDPKTVLRGGFRIAYDPSFYNIHLNVASGAPVVNSATLQTPALLPGLPTTGFTGTETRTVGLPFIPTGGDPALRGTESLVAKNFHNPYSEQWTLGIQRELSSNMALEVRYLGNHGVGLFQNLASNPGLNYYIAKGFANVIPSGLRPCADPTQPGFGTGTNFGHPDCARRNVQLRANSAFNFYHALQSRFEVRSFHGLTTTVAYTWSHNIDNASEIYSTVAAGMLSTPQNPFNWAAGERSNSNYDYRHTVGLQFVYDLPFFKDQQGLLGRVLGGWESSVTYRYSTGQPWTPIENKTTGNGFCDTTNLFSSATDLCRPILGNVAAPLNAVGQITAITAGVPTVKNVTTSTATTTRTTTLNQVHWIVNNDFAAQYFGNPFLGVRRNPLTGQPTHATNFSMQKNLRISERFTFQLRATAYNVLNHQFLGLPGNNVSLANTTFANFTRANSGGSNPNTLESGLSRRRLEFGGKIVF